MPARPTMQLDVSFLRDIYFSQADLVFRAIDPIDFPPFGGSELRGVLGHAFRERLCALRPPCPTECRQPAQCTYFSIFERSRTGTGQDGMNLPKPMILEPPVPAELPLFAVAAQFF